MSGPKPKRRKLSGKLHETTGVDQGDEVNTCKPSAVFEPKRGRQYTVSIAIPGSIIANVHTPDQKTALVGQIGRACSVFCVDEIVVFDDGQAQRRPAERDGYTAYSDPNFFMFHLLSYLETPPHLRKPLFPIHADLKGAGMLPSLDMPHHLKADEWCDYREGVTTGQNAADDTTTVATGLPQKVIVPGQIETNSRVTVKFKPKQRSSGSNFLEAEVVGPEAPREEAGYSWGYTTRLASSLSAVFTQCPFEDGYDMTVGTSERGVHLPEIIEPSASSHYVPPTWKHLLVVFGGVAGLEAAFKVDAQLHGSGAARVGQIFDRWVNLVPGQGSRTIRTEEALWLGLMGLRPLVTAREAV